MATMRDLDLEAPGEHNPPPTMEWPTACATAALAASATSFPAIIDDARCSTSAGAISGISPDLRRFGSPRRFGSGRRFIGFGVGGGLSRADDKGLRPCSAKSP